MLSGSEVWNTTLKDFGDQLQLPYDRRPSTSIRTGRASMVNLELDRGESLLIFASQAQATLFQVYLSAYYVFLYKLTQCQDLIIDSHVTNASRYEITRTTSMFDRFVPFRLYVEPEKTFVHLIELVKIMAHRIADSTKTLPYMTIGFRFQTITSESLRPQTASQLYNCLRSTALIYHLYGPTECIFATTFHLVTKYDIQQDSLPIGRPLAGYTCHVLDTYLQPVLCDDQLHHAYQTQFQQSINISDLFRRATIFDHAQLLETHQMTIEPQWYSFNINKGPASFAQTRLYLDERVRFVTANRIRAELENLIGVFVNTLPYRLIIEPHSSFTSLMQRVKDLALVTLPYAHLPFQQIATNTNIASLQTLFDVETLQDDEIALDSQTLLHPLNGSTTDPYSVAKFDLTCTLHYNVHKRSMAVSLNASSDLFETITIELLAQRFECLLRQLLTYSASTAVSQFSPLLPHEIQIVDQLDSSNQLLLPSNLLLIHEQFACRAWEHPQKLAVILDDQSLTYAELFYSSQLMARHLIDQYQVQSGDIVGQCVERSIEMSIGIMAILFSGASYLPLSPHEPSERLQLLIGLTRPRCVLTHSSTNHLIQNNNVAMDTLLLCPNIATDSEPLAYVNVSMNDIAFLIFTSGSTGIPKVVPTNHRNFTYMVQSYRQLQFHGSNYIIIQMASCSFDEHANECMGGLICGATIVLLRPHGNLDTHYLCETIEKNQATRIDFVPASIAILGEYLSKQIELTRSKHLATVKMITVGGEQLQGKTVKAIFNHLQSTCVLANIYAPAECTISALYYKIKFHDNDIPQIVPIGRCLPGRKVLVLDKWNTQVIPDGRNIGQIFLGGVGIFSGYLNDLEASEKVLVRFPNHDGVFYRTGDLARITPDGQLVFVGRIDFQVK
ncbi:hypothetical protein I4U23_027573 [Adineta vaga]|nr:hypothetical protein I4U23_027573 [Adineta vaga]